jgi:hypothetical protein
VYHQAFKDGMVEVMTESSEVGNQTFKEYVTKSIDLIARFSGWGFEGLNYTRMILQVLLNKITKMCNRWAGNFKDIQWHA